MKNRQPMLWFCMPILVSSSSGDKHTWFEEPLRSEKQKTKLSINANFHTRLEITSFTKITQKN